MDLDRRPRAAEISRDHLAVEIAMTRQSEHFRGDAICVGGKRNGLFSQTAPRTTKRRAR